MNRRNQRSAIERQRMVSEKPKNKEGQGEFYKVYKGGGIRLTPKGLSDIKEKWRIARGVFKTGGKNTTKRIKNIFSGWPENIPDLVDTLIPLTKNPHIGVDDLFNFFTRRGWCCNI